MSEMNITSILRKYTGGKATVDETNEALAEAQAAFPVRVYIDPQRNVITPEEAGRFGLLDTGTGSFDKVEVDPQRMELLDCKCGEMKALCIFNGELYTVNDYKLEVYKDE